MVLSFSWMKLKDLMKSLLVLVLAREQTYFLDKTLYQPFPFHDRGPYVSTTELGKLPLLYAYITEIDYIIGTIIINNIEFKLI